MWDQFRVRHNYLSFVGSFSFFFLLCLVSCSMGLTFLFCFFLPFIKVFAAALQGGGLDSQGCRQGFPRLLVGPANAAVGSRCGAAWESQSSVDGPGVVRCGLSRVRWCERVWVCMPPSRGNLKMKTRKISGEKEMGIVDRAVFSCSVFRCSVILLHQKKFFNNL